MKAKKIEGVFKMLDIFEDERGFCKIGETESYPVSDEDIGECLMAFYRELLGQ